jgi:hypothetical protein
MKAERPKYRGAIHSPMRYRDEEGSIEEGRREEGDEKSGDEVREEGCGEESREEGQRGADRRDEIGGEESRDQKSREENSCEGGQESIRQENGCESREESHQEAGGQASHTEARHRQSLDHAHSGEEVSAPEGGGEGEREASRPIARRCRKTRFRKTRGNAAARHPCRRIEGARQFARQPRDQFASRAEEIHGAAGGSAQASTFCVGAAGAVREITPRIPAKSVDRR